MLSWLSSRDLAVPSLPGLARSQEPRWEGVPLGDVRALPLLSAPGQYFTPLSLRLLSDNTEIAKPTS